ncbi:MAG: type III secretion system export apparatus subunit SctU [Simkania sp.]|nr:type III secretion system export apparatus subunit SctU [Simkania sp.]
MAEKSEKATPKKLRDARKKGQVAKSQDFPAAFTFVVSISAVIASAGVIYTQLLSYFSYVLKGINGTLNLQDSAGSYISQALTVIMNCSLPVMVITTLVGITVSFLITGPVFSMEAMKFDVKRLNPVSNLKNIFKMKTLFELTKSVLKITGAVILIYTVVNGSLQELISTAAMPMMEIVQVVSSFLVQVALRVGIFFLAIGLMDLIYQKHNFGKEMRMEKFEVKQEYKDTEGDPHIKGKRKQTAQEIAYQEGPNATKRARAVITNPEHLAIAIEYEEETEPAPKIVTMGMGIIAERIIKVAIEYHVPVMRNVDLARTLYQKGKMSDYIPEETYQAVAEILKWLKKMETGEEETLEIFK